ncbi:hypothetical protein AAU33_15040 [Listeria monocytogenes]|nr:hypothetical protein [Listeria monocytogenes]EAC3174333.1 hypothetical protein [Listeria monocytogenes]
MMKEIKLYMLEEQKQKGHAVKSIVYSFLIEEDVIQTLRMKETHVETVVLLQLKITKDWWGNYGFGIKSYNTHCERFE